MSRMRNILVANRGEIALRIIRTARALDYRTTAIYSEADARAPHAAAADLAVCVGPAPVGASYLAIDRILDAARRSGADAVHPGYGLLSENAAFARACVAAGLTFIGPRPETIEALGDKRQARLAMRAQGVPIVPGYDGADQDLARLETEAERIGFPVMVKAAAGGGGRGMRRVSSPAELREALVRARSEAEKAFGDGRLILERALDRARHVEIQVFADAHGQVIHLGERDCSVQRRFQKVIEEAPSPAVDADLRERMGRTAVDVARRAGYLGAGTVELLLEASGEFYFLEMNTRLQVEHPVTELVTGTDLVAWQLRIAEGEPLPLSQSRIELRGCAIEARLYAEDPARQFVPVTGRVLALTLPDPALVRIDHGLAPGLEIGSHYDPMLGKLIAHGPDREAARRRLVRALEALRVLGVQTNQAFLAQVLEHPVFVAGQADTRFLDTQLAGLAPEPPSPELLAIAAALLVLTAPEPHGSARELRGFSNGAGVRTRCELECEGQRYVRDVARRAADELEVWADDQPVRLGGVTLGREQVVLRIDGVRRTIAYAVSGDELFVQSDARAVRVRDVTYAAAARSDGPQSGAARAPMDGSVVEVPVAVGQAVQRGQTVAVVEAMKLELRVLAELDGVVRAVHVERGAQVKARQVLVEVEAATPG